MISRLDQDVGTILAKLKEHKLDENTVVFFTSDNGPHKEGNNDPAFFDSSGPLRGIKRSLNDGGIRVPMIVRWPGHIQPATVTDHVAYHGDVMATLCEIANLTGPKSALRCSDTPESTLLRTITWGSGVKSAAFGSLKSGPKMRV